MVVVEQQLVEPLLNRGLAARAGDSDDGDVKLHAMLSGKVLQRIKHARYMQDIACMQHVVVNAFKRLDHKTAYALVIETVDISLSSGVLCCGQREEQCLGGHDQRARVSKQLAYIGLGSVELGTSHAHHLSNFLDSIFH